MAIRYEDASDDVRRLVDKVIADYFNELRNARIVALFDMKKHLSGGQVLLSNIMKPNELVRHFTRAEASSSEGYDYIITIDKKGWETISEEDRIRLLRHELRHTFYDIEAEDNPYKLIEHSVADFYEEIELNQDDPKWRQRVSTMVADMYEQEKEDAKEKRGKRGKRKGRDE
jgi:predicted metallopeptidase